MPNARKFEFVLVLGGVSDLTDEVLNALYEAGCDDATPSLRLGRVYLSFAREAPSLKEAILSAIRDVRRAPVGAGVLSVDGRNLVSQSDIARRIGRTRQQVGQYVSGNRGPGNFPGPVFEVSVGHPLWSWSEVAAWLCENGIVGEDVLEDSRVLAAINSVLEQAHQRQHDPLLVDDVARFMEEPLPA